jgi:general stress protein YciG
MATSSGSNKGSGNRSGSDQTDKAADKGTDKAAGNKQSDTSTRGFASMDPQRQREIASEGGRAAHEKGTAHEFTPDEARQAGSQSHKNDTSRQGASGGGTPQDEGGNRQGK